MSTYLITEDRRINIKSAVIYWCITTSYMALIFYLSSRSGLKMPVHFINADKIVHALVYMPLAYFFALSLMKSGISRCVFLIAALSAAFYGITDEIHQHFVAGRDASIGDALADFTGAFLGSLLARSFRI